MLLPAQGALLLITTLLLGSEGEPSSGETVVIGTDEDLPASVDGRAGSVVDRFELERRLPRSAPDALRYEPGVFIQQTAHGQGSAFIRGLTGQQTLILFDGIRLNNSTFRQGPNQYFFTLDSATIEQLEVVRGGSSTRYGSDALGGVILTRPLEPRGSDGATWSVRPTLSARGATADLEHGGRVQVEASTPGNLSLLAGAGARRAGLLRSGGPVQNLSGGGIPEVPRFAGDGRTQLGTGFDEITADARAVWRQNEQHTATLAAYLYRQFDAPRTDQCPAPAARFDECLTYDEQFRTLVYGASSWKPGLPGLARMRTTVSWQQQHERRRGERPASFVVNRGVDDVHTFGVSLAAESFRFETPFGPALIGYGADSYFDQLESSAEIAFTDIDVTVQRARGQYLSGSTFLYGGAFALAEVAPVEVLRLRGGGRFSWIHARAPGDAASGSSAVDASWFPLVGFLGAEWQAHPALRLFVNVDHSFRAPNLDDLTSRQQTGPGFQFENAHLRPERATTFELGASIRQAIASLDVWLFQAGIVDAIGREPREADACPPNTPQCSSSWSRFQLVNVDGVSTIRGAEVAARVRLPGNVGLRSSAAWTWGEGPADRARIPLSRIPPLNGTAELSWVSRFGLGLGAAMRWAAAQDRLALQDYSDARIPVGGTPGFAVFDARAWYHAGERVRLSLVAENLLDTPYRYHGSSVNGPGRGLMLAVEVAPF